MAKTKKTSKRARSSDGYVKNTTFVRGMVFLFTSLSLVYLAVVYWRFG